MISELDKAKIQMAKQHQDELDKAQIHIAKEHQREMDKAAINTWNRRESKDNDKYLCPNITQMARDLMDLDKALKMILELCLERADNDDDRAELVTLLAECETRLEEYPLLMS